MSETDFLKLKKHDNVETNTEKFDIENYLNGNWDKINENAINSASNTLTPKQLYNNTSGTTGTVTLNETSANFSYLEIFFDAYGYKSVRVFSPNGKTVLLQGIAYADTVYHLWKNVLISGTSITVSNEYRVAEYNDGKVVQQNTNQVKIYRVLGYR